MTNKYQKLIDEIAQEVANFDVNHWGECYIEGEDIELLKTRLENLVDTVLAEKPTE